jgi:hypothetical protein
VTEYSNRQLIEEFLARRYERDHIDDLFKPQKAVVLDSSRYKGIQTSRRAGKSRTASSELLEGAKTPHSMNPYIGLTRESAERIIWPTFLELVERYNLPCEVVESKLSLYFPKEKSEIFLVGADQKNFAERLRGIKIKRAVIDEAQSFRSHIRTLVDDIITPALVDLSGGLSVYGTPGIVPEGFFYEITNENRGYSVHKWTIFDNPHIPNAKEFIEDMLKRRGWSTQNPTYRREWLNEWVKDLDALLYRFNAERNLYSRLPTGVEWNHILGMDFGLRDKTAFVVIAWNINIRKAFVIHSESKAGMIPSEIAERSQQLIKIFAPTTIVADTGGLGASIAEEMRRRYQIPIKAAEKKDKATKISLLNGDLIDQNLYISVECKNLHHEMNTIPRNEKGIEEDGYPCDETDAMLYAYNEARNYLSEPKKKPLDPKSDAYAEKMLEDEDMRGDSETWWDTLA